MLGFKKRSPEFLTGCWCWQLVTLTLNSLSRAWRPCGKGWAAPSSSMASRWGPRESSANSHHCHGNFPTPDRTPSSRHWRNVAHLWLSVCRELPHRWTWKQLAGHLALKGSVCLTFDWFSYAPPCHVNDHASRSLSQTLLIILVSIQSYLNM